MDYIRKTYRVPAKRGARVEYQDREAGTKQGVITGSSGAYLRIRLDGENKSKKFHPTHWIRYL